MAAVGKRKAPTRTEALCSPLLVAHTYSSSPSAADFEASAISVALLVLAVPQATAPRSPSALLLLWWKVKESLTWSVVLLLTLHSSARSLVGSLLLLL